MKVIIIFFALVGLTFFGCRKSKTNPVPIISFDVTINTDLPSYSALQGVGGWAYVNGGSRGVVVYRRSLEEFVAFDRHSPEDPEGICPTPLTPDSNNYLLLIDACSDAQYSLNDGSAIKGSDYGLRQYPTMWNGTNQLRIYN